MLKEILSVFKSDAIMQRAYKRSFEMMEKTQEMFLHSKEILRRTEHNKVEINIYDEDTVVNKYQR